MRAILACWVVLGVAGAVSGCGGVSSEPTPDSSAGLDAGSGSDAGPRLDTGVPPVDAGVPPVDTGVPPVDAGVPPVDTGVPPGDTGLDAATASDTGVDAASATDAGGACTSDSDCPSRGGTTRFCMFPTGACGGTGTCATSGGICSALFAPVCGCDGATYSNASCATAAGVSVDHDGACGTATGCAVDRDCAGGEFCDFTDGTCGGTGTCISRGIGVLCVATCTPECGCDGSWYQNQCYREQAGTSLDAAGGCRGTPPCATTCGCVRDRDCSATEECVATASGGVCHPKLTVPMCWRNSDCPRGQTCMGERVCPCGASCFAADAPGTCG